MAQQWFVGLYQPGRGALARRELSQQGFSTYMPMYVAEWKRVPKVQPFLPGYIFIHMDSEAQRWRSILSTYGMRTMLCSDNRPSPIPDWVIDEIRSREVNELVQLPPPMKCKFQKGDKVSMKGSPLQMIFDEPVDSKRAAVFYSILGRNDLRAMVPMNRLYSSAYAAAG